MADDLKNGKIEALFANVTAIGGGVILRWHVCVRHKHWNKQLLLFGDFFASVKPWLMGSIKKKEAQKLNLSEQKVHQCSQFQ